MERTKEIVKVSIRGILANLVLVAFKAVVGILANSTAVILDAVNNLSDALSSVITIVGTKLAGKAPDKKHPYGYGRIEYFTSLIIAVIVLIAGLTSLYESIGKIIAPEETAFTFVSVVILAAGVAVKLLLGAYFQKRGRELNAGSLVASGADARGDAILSLATLLAALLTLIFRINIDGWLGAVISLFIIKAGGEMILDTVNTLIGARIDPELSAKVKELVCTFPEVRGAYDLILHGYGPEEHFGSVHVEVPDTLTARELDALTRRIVPKVYGETGVLLTVGVYASADEGPAARMTEALRGILTEYPEVLQMHGFYYAPETQSASFDLIFDFKTPDPAGKAAEIREKMTARFPGTGFHIVLDRDFSD